MNSGGNRVGEVDRADVIGPAVHEAVPVVVTVSYFASAAELVGLARETLEVDRPTVGALRRSIVTAHPALAELLPVCTFLVDEALVRAEDEPIGDSVDVLPPFSGG